MPASPGRKARSKLTKAVPPRDLSYLTEMGAGTRSHTLFRDLKTFVLPVAVAIVIQTVLYAALYTRTAPRWPALLTVIGVLAFVPIASALTLTAFRRHQAPITSGVITVVTFFSFAVTLLSAMRVQISFAGLAAALPAMLIIVATGNVRFHRRLATRVAIVAHDEDNFPLLLLGTEHIARITDPFADLSAFDTVLIEPSRHHTPEWSGLLSRCYVQGIDIMPWTQFLEIRKGFVHVPSFDVAQLAYTPGQMLYARSKRLLDVLAVLVTLPLTVPLAAATAFYIFVRDGGPVLFVQHRLGFGGKPFRIYKFRTMYKGTKGGATTSNDRRIIPGCKFIRRVRLDELPQLYNILVGDMSLIGPRPEALDLTRWYRREIPQWDFRMLVLPGLTGWAQVNSGYTSNPDEARIKLAYDLYYIKNLSFDLDLQVLFKTVRTILFGSGAR